jgi:NAD(P)-dependent dehydrogenase (short-subunit alcohol dehydrogenase family)
MPPTVYLVSGANRGIGTLNIDEVHTFNIYYTPGLGLVTTLARRDNVMVFAGARNPTAAADLHALVQQYPGKVHIVKLTSCDKDENKAAVATITDIAGRLDVVIANAGTSVHLLSFEFKNDLFLYRNQ